MSSSNHAAGAADNNNNNNNSNADHSLLQQLLNRLHEAHDSIELDPIQGQFLLDASGGDLDIAVGLYWEDSVAHAARDNGSHGNAQGRGNRQGRGGSGGGSGRGGNDAAAAAENPNRRRSRSRSKSRKRHLASSSASASLSDVAKLDAALLRVRGIGIGTGTGSSDGRNHEGSILNGGGVGDVGDDDSGMEQEQPQQRLLNRRRSRKGNSNSGSSINVMDDIPLKRSSSDSGSGSTGSKRRASSSSSSSIRDKLNHSSSNSSSMGMSNSQIDDFIRELSRSTSDSKRGVGNNPNPKMSTRHGHDKSNSRSDKSSNGGKRISSSHRAEKQNLRDLRAARHARKKYNNDNDNDSLSSTELKLMKDAESEIDDAIHPPSPAFPVPNHPAGRGRDRERERERERSRGRARYAHEDLDLFLHSFAGDHRRRNLQQFLEQQQQLQQQQQQAVAAAAETEASNVSDDEAAAIVERLWKQIKPKGTKNKAYKHAIQRQIQRMTRKRKKRRTKLHQTLTQNSSSHSEDNDVGVRRGDAMDLDGDDPIGGDEDEEDIPTGSEIRKKLRKRSLLKDNASVCGNSKEKPKRRSMGMHLRKNRKDNLEDMTSSDDNGDDNGDDNDDDDDDDGYNLKPSADGTSLRNDDDSDMEEEDEEDEEVAKKSSNPRDLKNMLYNHQKKRKRSRRDDNNHNNNKSNDGEFVSSSTLDGDESDLEKVNIANFEDVFNLATYEAVTASQILWGEDQEAGGDSNGESQLNRAQLEENNNAAAAPRNDNDAEEGHPDNDANVVINGGEDNDQNKDALEVISNTDANDEEEDVDDANDDDDIEEEEHSKSHEDLFGAVIPRTWLSTGFQLSSCATGLVMPRPVDTELARLKRIQNAKFSRGTSSMQPPLPPYHCGSITALLSIVTALLYTGASIQGKEVNCNSNRKKPFAELSDDDRRKEFPERLTTALSALLFIAAKESTKHRLETLADIEKRLHNKRKKRKKHKLELAVTYDSDEGCDSSLMGNEVSDKDRELMMKQLIQHQVRLCQVCHWEVDKGTKELKIPLDQLIDNQQNLQFKVSLTNVKDLRSFVRSNLRSFMSPGGCALFLESIVHIHGIPRLTRILNELRGNPKAGNCKPLIRCNCEDEVKLRWDEALQKYQEKAMTSSIRTQQSYDDAPPGHSCMNNELISLLINGKPQNDVQSDSASKLGFGLLSIKNIGLSDEPNVKHQSQDSKPIWVVKGSSSYSVLWNNDIMANTDKAAPSPRENLHPFHLSYWNSWYDPIAKKFDGKVIPERKMFSDIILPTSNITEQVDTNKSSNVQSEKDEIMEVIPHPEDQEFYKDFHHWRFCLSKEKDNAVLTDRHWVSFFRMSRREKNLVEMKMAPQINRAIWSLWPGSEIVWKPSAKLIS